mgnify:FL=1
MPDNKRYSTLMNNTLLFAISNLSSKLLSLISQPYLSYILDGPDVMGVTKLMQQVTNLLIPIVSLGVSYAVIRFGLDKSKDKSSVFMNGLATIATGFTLMVLCWPLVAMIPNAGDYLLLLYLCVLMSCLRTLCTQFIRARMLNRLVAVDGVLTMAELVGCYVIYLHWLDLGAVGYLLAVATSDALSTLFVFIVGKCYKFFSLRKFSMSLWKEMLRYCVPMIPASISFWVINASDMFFVQAMCEGVDGRSGNEWAGLLSTGYFLPQILTLVGQTFYEAWQLSAVSEETDREAFFSKVFRVYASVLFCCAAGVVWLCRPLMRMFQASYFDAWQFVPFLVFSSMCTCLNQFTNSVFVVFKRSVSSLYTMLAGAILNVILNYVFILVMGPVGVTLASFLSLLLVFLLRAYSTRGLLEINFRPGWMLLNAAIVLAETALLYLFPEQSLWLCAIPTAIVIAINFRDVWHMAMLLLQRFVPRLHRKS